MREIKVLVNASCYPTNIGNAFIDMGVIYSLKSALGTKGTVLHIGRMSNFLFLKSGEIANTLPIEEIVDCDYVVMGGMVMCVDHLQGAAKTLRCFAERGTRIIIAGGGARVYDNLEVKKVRELLKDIPLYGFISRDEYTYEQYKDLATYSYNGIDSALFIGDCFQPIEINLPEYIVINFDSTPEPHIDSGGRLVIRTHHSCWPELCKPDFFSKPNTLISDLASDYLTLYAQTAVTYTDRIHAAIATLAFGHWARLYFREGDMRLHMFQRLGVPKIYKMPVRLDLQLLTEEKENQIKFLRTILLEKMSKGTYLKNAQLGDNVTKQQIPECSILLLVTEKKANLCKAINSILSQTFVDFNLFVVDFTPENVAKIEVENYEDSRVHYVVKQFDIPLISIFEDISSKYVTCISPDVIYEPYFLYELKKSLQTHLEAPLVYSDWRQIGSPEPENIVSSDCKSPKRNSKDGLKNVGFCFLAQRELIIKESSFRVNIFDSSDFWLPLIEINKVHYLPEVLGRKVKKVRIWKSIKTITRSSLASKYKIFRKYMEK